MTLITRYRENKEKYNRLHFGEFKKALEPHYTNTFHNSRTTKDYTGYQTTYGELTLNGLEDILRYLKEDNKSFNDFIDIGCGKGRAVLYMSAFDNIRKSVGVELVTERANHAKDVMNKMRKNYKYFLNSADIIEGDFTKLNYNNMFSNKDNTLIWISNLCFSEDVNAKILSKIQKEFGKKYIICCSKELPHNNSLKKIFQKPIAMSWDSKSMVHAYIPAN